MAHGAFVVMPSAIGSIMTGATLAIARAAGETAPLLFTTSIFLPNQVVTDPSHAMAAVPLTSCLTPSRRTRP